MHPLKLTIAGRYWDSLLYSGRLYLFLLDGSIITLDWDRLISLWHLRLELRLAMVAAFRRGDLLYSNEVRLILHDPQVKLLVQTKFRELQEIELHVDAGLFAGCTVGQQDNPFPFPHADADIYCNNIYVGSQFGAFRGSCGSSTRRPVSTRRTKLWDGPVLGMSASYLTLAMAAGSDGLFQQYVGQRRNDHDRREPSCISQRHCSHCSWVFHSLYASPHVGGGFLADYDRKSVRENYEPRRHWERTFIGETASEAIFDATGYSWGVQDKLYLASGGRLAVAKYTPFSRSKERYARLGTVEISGDPVVSGSAAPFGTIVEVDRGLRVLLSTGGYYDIPGEPTNWRVLPRSKHYQNQLHVVHDDRLEIYSFNHDYFVEDQESKLLGLEHFRSARSRSDEEVAQLLSE